jgi:hypothetical protein
VAAVEPGQQTDRKRPKSASLNDGESNHEDPAKPHELSDSASIVVNRRDTRTGIDL